MASTNGLDKFAYQDLNNIYEVNVDVATFENATVENLTLDNITPLTNQTITINGNVNVPNPFLITGTITEANHATNATNAVNATNANYATTAATAATANYATTAGSSTTATTAVNFTGPLSGDITGTQNATQISAGVIVNADINASAGIVDTKLATISTTGKVSNSATTGTSSNTINTLVLRDSSGNFVANVITATLNGIATSFSGNLTGVVTSAGMVTTIPSGNITNAMLQQLTATNLVANSANTLLASATSANTTGTLVLRDNTIFTALSQLSTSNINLNSLNPTGNRYNYIQLLGGNSSGFIYGAYAALADGINIGYNFYYNNNSTTPTIPNTAGSTCRLMLGYGTISFCTGAVNTAPTTYWTINSAGILRSFNGGVLYTSSITSASGPLYINSDINASAQTITASTITTTTINSSSGTIGVGNNVNAAGYNIACKSLNINSGGTLASALQLLSGGTGNYITQGIGRTATEIQYGIAAANGNFFTDVLVGDGVIIHDNINSALNVIRLGARSTAGSYVASALIIRYGNKASTTTTDGSVVVNGSLGVTTTAIIGSSLTAQSITSNSSITATSITCSGTTTSGNFTTSGTVTTNTISCSNNGSFGTANVTGAITTNVAIITTTATANRFIASNYISTPTITAPSGTIDFSSASLTNVNITDSSNNVTANNLKSITVINNNVYALTGTTYITLITIPTPATGKYMYNWNFLTETTNVNGSSLLVTLYWNSSANTDSYNVYVPYGPGGVQFGQSYSGIITVTTGNVVLRAQSSNSTVYAKNPRLFLIPII